MMEENTTVAVAEQVSDAAAENGEGDSEVAAEMRACESLEDILEVIADEAPHMSASDAAYGLYKVAFLSKKASPEGTS